MEFGLGKYRVKSKRQSKSHNSKNPIKWKDMNLKLLGRMVFDKINIIEHNNCKNKSIKMTKNNQPPKGGKGPSKDGPVRRLLRGK